MRATSELQTVGVFPVAAGVSSRMRLIALGLAVLTLCTLSMPYIAPAVRWWQGTYVAISLLAALAALLWFVRWAWELMIRKAADQELSSYGAAVVVFGTALFTPAAAMSAVVAAIAWPVAALILAGYRLVRR